MLRTQTETEKNYRQKHKKRKCWHNIFKTQKGIKNTIKQKKK